MPRSKLPAPNTDAELDKVLRSASQLQRVLEGALAQMVGDRASLS